MCFDAHACRRRSSNRYAAATTSDGTPAPAHGHGDARAPYRDPVAGPSDGHSHTCAADADATAPNQHAVPDPHSKR